MGNELVENGTFDTDYSGWEHWSNNGGSISWSDGKLVITGLGGEFLDDRGRARQTISNLIVGSTYKMMFTLDNTDNEAVRLGANAYNQSDYNDTVWGGAGDNQPGDGTTTVYFTAITTNLFIVFEEANDNTLTVDDVSVKEVLTAASTGNIPFGSTNRDWDAVDIDAPITNNDYKNEYLLIDTELGSQDGGASEDKSGNENIGLSFGDYRIQFTEGRLPTRNDVIIKTENENDENAF